MNSSRISYSCRRHLISNLNYVPYSFESFLTFTGHPVPDPHAVFVPGLIPAEGDVEGAALDRTELDLVDVGQ